MAIYTFFSRLLDYPETDPAPFLRDFIPALDSECPEAAALLRNFQSGVAGKSLGEIQELYTATFDMRPDCTPGLGYHLFGDEARRSFFLIRLKDRLEAHGIDPGHELPDHLPVVLRLIETQGPGEESEILIHDCLIPALTRMMKTFGQSQDAAGVQIGDGNGNGNPYGQAIKALLAYLQRDAGEEIAVTAPGEKRTFKEIHG